MIFTLKTRNIPICRFDIKVSSNGVKFKKLIVLKDGYRRQLLPLPLQNVSKRNMAEKTEEWFKSRVIPADRQGLDELLKNILKQPVRNTYGTAQILALCAYGASLSDTFWLSPTQDYTLNLPGHPLNGFVIQRHPKYAGLTMLESPVFQQCVLGGENNNADSCRYIWQDFNMAGAKSKFISCEDNQKFFINKFTPDALSYCNKATLCASKFPTYCTPFRKLTDEDDEVIGYSNQVLSSDLCSVITCKDLVQWMNFDDKCTWENLKAAFSELGLQSNILTDFQEIKESFFNDDNDDSKNIERFFKHSGFIYNNRDQSIIKPIVWF